MEIEIKVSQPHVEAIFKSVSSKRYKKEVNFDPITIELSKLKEGGRLNYEHLELISDNNVWPFSRWWRWPTKDQISEYLLKTEGLFKCLNGLSEIHEERLEIEKNIIHVLYYDIFKEQVEMSELEEKLSNLLPKLQENGLIDKMILTEAGRKIIQIKKSIFYQTSLVAVNLN